MMCTSTTSRVAPASASACNCEIIGVMPLPAAANSRPPSAYRGENLPCAWPSRTTCPGTSACAAWDTAPPALALMVRRNRPSARGAAEKLKQRPWRDPLTSSSRSTCCPAEKPAKWRLGRSQRLRTPGASSFKATTRARGSESDQAGFSAVVRRSQAAGWFSGAQIGLRQIRRTVEPRLIAVKLPIWRTS
jgi:hypothetical protein